MRRGRCRPRASRDVRSSRASHDHRPRSIGGSARWPTAARSHRSARSTTSEPRPRRRRVDLGHPSPRRRGRRRSAPVGHTPRRTRRRAEVHGLRRVRVHRAHLRVAPIPGTGRRAREARAVRVRRDRRRRRERCSILRRATRLQPATPSPPRRSRSTPWSRPCAGWHRR